MVTPSSFKYAILANPNTSPSVNLNDKIHEANHNASPSVPESHCHDPPRPPTFPKSVVLDDLPQVKIDIEELSKSCLFAKIMSVPLDVRIIRARTKID